VRIAVLGAIEVQRSDAAVDLGGREQRALLVDPVNRFLQRRVLGDLTRYGLPAARGGVVAQARATGVTPTIDVGLVAELRAGRVTPVAAVERFDGGKVVLTDGTRFACDAVIAATGYTTGLPPVVGHLGVLDERGRPHMHGRRTAPGLRFVGLSNPLKGLPSRSTSTREPPPGPLHGRWGATTADRELHGGDPASCRRPADGSVHRSAHHPQRALTCRNCHTPPLHSLMCSKVVATASG
jgi:hypothetical protein